MTSAILNSGSVKTTAASMANSGTSSATALPNNNATINISLAPPNTTTLHQANQLNTATRTYNNSDIIAQLKQHFSAEQEARVQNYKQFIINTRSDYAKADAVTKHEIKLSVVEELNELMNQELISLASMQAEIAKALAGKERNQARELVYAARTISQEQALNFLNKIAAIDRANADELFDIAPSLNKDFYTRIAAVAVGGELSSSNANVMREAFQGSASLNAEAEHNSKTSKESMVATNEAAMSALEALVTNNYGTLVNNSFDDADIANIATQTMDFTTSLDTYRIQSQRNDNPPAAVHKVAQFFIKLNNINTSLVERCEKVAKVTQSLGLDKSLVSPIAEEVNRLRAHVKQTLGTIKIEQTKKDAKSIEVAVQGILLRDSNTNFLELRRAAAKSLLHALVMVSNGKFGKNEFYEQNGINSVPQWQKNLYYRTISRYQKALSSTSAEQTKKAESQLLNELSVVANELRIKSKAPFRLASFAESRKFEPELSKLLHRSLNATKPNQINMGLSVSSSLFFGDAITMIMRDPSMKEADAKATLRDFELYQNRLMLASQAENFNEASLAKFYTELLHTKSGDGTHPAMSSLLKFISSSMLPDSRAEINTTTDKNRNIQRAELNALFHYYLVTSYLPVDANDKNNLQCNRLFSKLYLDPKFRAQLNEELRGAELAAHDKITLIEQFNKAHIAKVNELAKALESELSKALQGKSGKHQTKNLCEEYINLEHDLNILAKDPKYAKDANNYKVLGFKQFLAPIYDYDKDLALSLYHNYAQSRIKAGTIDNEAKDSAAEVLGKHLVERLKAKQNTLKVEMGINGFAEHVSRADNPIMRMETSGHLYHNLRAQALLVELSRTSLKAETKALIQKQITRQETLRELIKFKSSAGHLVVDCGNTDELNAASGILEDVLVLATTFPDTINQILGSDELAPTRAILNAQFIGIDRAEVTNRHPELTNRLKRTGDTSATLARLGLTQSQGRIGRITDPDIQEHQRSPKEIAETASTALRGDAPIALAA